MNTDWQDDYGDWYENQKELEDDEKEFNPCSKCDGHPACEDFGCAIELGLARMVKKNNPFWEDNWS